MANAQELRNQEESLINQTIKDNLELFTKCFENKAYIFNILKGNYVDQFIHDYQTENTLETTNKKERLIKQFDELMDRSIDENTRWEAINVIMKYKQNARQLKANNCKLVEKPPQSKTTRPMVSGKKTNNQQATLTKEQCNQLKEIMIQQELDRSEQIQAFCEYLLKQNPKIDPKTRNKTLAMLPKLFHKNQVKKYQKRLNKQHQKQCDNGYNYGNKTVSINKIQSEIKKLEKQLEKITPNVDHPNLKHYQLYLQFEKLYSCAFQLQTKHKNRRIPSVQYKYFLEADVLSHYYETTDLPRPHRYWEAFATVLNGVTVLTELEKQTKMNQQIEWNNIGNQILSNSDTTYKEKIINYVTHYFDQFNQEFKTPVDVYNRINNTKIQNMKRSLHTSKQKGYEQEITMEQLQHRCDQLQQSDLPNEYKDAINIATLTHLKAYPIAKRLAGDRKLKLVRQKDLSEAEVLLSFYENFDKITNPKQQLQHLKKLIRFASNASKISGNPKQFGDRHTLKQHVKNPLNIHK